jgi:hypothetical protein
MEQFILNVSNHILVAAYIPQVNVELTTAGHSRYRFAHRDKPQLHVAHHKKKTPLRCLFFCGAAGNATQQLNYY